MKYLFALLIFILACNLANAQTRAEKELIRFAIGNDNIYYNEKVRDYDIDQIREALTSDTLFDWKHMAWHEKYGLPDSLIFVLAKAEHAEINKQLDDMKGFIWKNNLFQKSLAVNWEKMAAYKKAHAGELGFKKEDYQNGGYAFTKPVFIRNKTIAFIYLTHHEGGYVMMYIKDRNRWKVKYMLTYWVS